jgi:hypothetical protein
LLIVGRPAVIASVDLDQNFMQQGIDFGRSNFNRASFIPSGA